MWIPSWQKMGATNFPEKMGVNNQYKKHLQKADRTSEVKLEISLVFSNLANLWKNKGWGKLGSYSQCTHSIFKQRKVGVFHRSFLEFEDHFERRKFTWNLVGSLWKYTAVPTPHASDRSCITESHSKRHINKTTKVNYNESAKTCPSKKCHHKIENEIIWYPFSFRFARCWTIQHMNWTLTQPFRSGPQVSNLQSSTKISTKSAFETDSCHGLKT